MGEIISYGNSGELGSSDGEKMLLEVSQDLLVDSKTTLENKNVLSVPIAELSTLGAGVAYAVLGMSMGGFIAIELLCKHPVKAEKLILDSGYMKPWKIAKPMAQIVASGFMKLKDGKADVFT